MPVNLSPPTPSDLHPVAGVRLGVAEAGIRKVERKDLTVILLEDGASVSGVFTRNRFCAAPVQVCREHFAAAAQIRALVINTGNANAGTGAEGLARARATCASLAKHLDVAPEQVLPFSTGVIMEPLPVERIEAGLPAALADLDVDHWGQAAQAIMTTDTIPKAASKVINLDACIAPSLMKQLALDLAEGSFNRVTIDGDTSTNDSFVVIATNKAPHKPLASLNQGLGLVLKNAMMDVARQLAQAIVRDGEGATKFITVRVEDGRSSAECRQVAYAIAHSPLVKTAFYASDPNLGRILAAVGYAGIDDLDPSLIDLFLDDVHVAVNGGRNPTYREEDGQRVMKQNEITVRIRLGRGAATDTVWTCDFSHEYVTINADYRS